VQERTCRHYPTIGSSDIVTSNRLNRGEIIVSALVTLGDKVLREPDDITRCQGHLFACVNIEGAGMGQWQEFGLSILNNLDAVV
jgi:hypothetical protein